VGGSTTIFALPKVYCNFEKQKNIFKQYTRKGNMQWVGNCIFPFLNVFANTFLFPHIAASSLVMKKGWYNPTHTN